MSRKKNIDTTDILILNKLQLDASISNLDLAREVGLTPSPTLTRVRNLTKKGVINGINARLNYQYFGYSYRAMIVCRVPKERAPDFGRLLAGLEFVITAHRLKPPNTLSTLQTIMFEVVAKTENEFVTAMGKQYSKLPYSVDFEIFPVEAVVKDTTSISLTLDDVG